MYTEYVCSAYDERELIKRAQRGDEYCFSLLAAHYSSPVYRIGIRMLGNSYDAEDMLQETMLKIYRHIGGFRGDSSFSSWVYAIAANCGRDMLRCHNRCRERDSLFSDAPQENEVLSPADDSPSPEELFLEKDIKLRIRQIMDSLDPKYRSVIVLREIYGSSYAEISELLGISVGTVKSRLFRARSSFAQTARETMELTGGASSA